ncbi:amino acid adenylation domain-containing protein [Pseudomonas promysalinigenes]|uniref:amino acid adenylation domain-containing protein n=1 Tax=Pseudomonas promysalinigenes TaxID=485898 RepID=UPI0037C96A7E
MPLKLKFHQPALQSLSEQDRQLFEQYGSGVVAEIPYQNVHHGFADMARSQPHICAARHGGQMITYGELDAKANALASHLIGLGVQQGDAVGLFLRRSIDMLVGLLGILKCGAAYVPVDIATTPPRLVAQVTEAAQVRLVLTQACHLALIPEGVECQVIETAYQTSAPAIRAPMVSGQATCFILFTSGTTGIPNGVKVSHANVCNLLFSAPGNLGIAPGDRVGQILHIGFDMAAWEILGCLCHGGTLLIRGADIAATAQHCSILIATPSILARLDPALCPHIKTVAVAGEPCPPSLAERWAAYCSFHNSCGPTETTIVNTMVRYRAASMLTIGKPTPNNSVYILDEHGVPCAIGDVGEMWAGGAGVSQGYVNNALLTEQRYRPDPFLGGTMFRTGDLGRWTATGELEHLGRCDDQVKVRGFRVELDAVAAALESLPGCNRAAALKLDDRQLVAFASPMSLDIEQALLRCRERLPYYAVPTRLTLLEELPLTGRGKIDRAVLRELLAAAQVTP